MYRACATTSTLRVQSIEQFCLLKCGSGAERSLRSLPLSRCIYSMIRAAEKSRRSRERHFTQHLKHPTSLNKTTRARRRSRLFGVKERVRVCRVCCASSGGWLGERMREKDRGRLPVAELTSTMTTVVVVENGFTLAASSKCSGTRGVPCFRLSGQAKGACAPADRRRLGVRRDGTLTV